MSRVQLHRKLKALSGQTTTEFIRTIRLKRAAQLLEQNFGTVAEVAYAVGFGNLSYFSKCFKAQFGVSPSEFGA
ncbi:MAG: helix-turn-helix transcriptional regulator [Bacteroidota bacterium]